MKQIKIILRILETILSNPLAITRVLDDDSYYKNRGYQKLPTIDLLTLIPDFSETVNPVSMLSNGSSIMDYALLRALARMYSPCRYLEIGTWRGESIANVSPIAEECYSIDLPKEDVNIREDRLDNIHFFFKRFNKCYSYRN